MGGDNKELYTTDFSLSSFCFHTAEINILFPPIIGIQDWKEGKLLRHRDDARVTSLSQEDSDMVESSVWKAPDIQQLHPCQLFVNICVILVKKNQLHT